MSNGVMTINKKLVRMWKESIMGYCKVLFLYLPGGPEVTHSLSLHGAGYYLKS
jgi:hypothetical protein